MALIGELGVPERSSSLVERAHADLLADALDLPSPGRRLPALWHWAFFPPRAATAALGEDGHPARPAGELAGLTRRMWVGGRVWFPGDLDVDTRTERRSALGAVVPKQGRQGPFVLVTLRHELVQAGARRVVEEQDLVFRPPAEAGAGTTPTNPPNQPESPAPTRSVVRPISPVLLFRYAALTFNAHRIHYDLDYATGVEGYPGLVIQGPLLATLLAGLATVDGGTLARFEYRSHAPAVAPSTLTLSLAETGDGPALLATRPDGVVSMSATATRR
ncbi:MAG: acyl-CoA dehydrogenase [Acidimicrobiia bacterium]